MSDDLLEPDDLEVDDDDLNLGDDEDDVDGDDLGAGEDFVESEPQP